MRTILLLFAVLGLALAGDEQRADLCRLLREPAKFAGRVVEVQGYLKPLMHGTYLKQEDCEESILLVLPDEIPNYKGSIKVQKDGNFAAFEKARFNYQSDAPRYTATFVGQIEYVKRRKGFGYNKNHRVRLVLQAVR